ncbi:unnamed protein product [Polarella glacialis]|uniref:TOG domain-containing protein n=1 Tax=Polarella glacialis TaxID=89957 RepID=A0A813FBD5_POLGL|nr:unnamed protein product [Polarella glacialis]
MEGGSERQEQTQAMVVSTDEEPIPVAAAVSTPLMEMPETPTGGMEGVSELVAEEDYSAEPLPARLASKDLGRRCSGYAEAQAAMEKPGLDATAEVFDIFKLHLFSCLDESLPKGQDAALTALIAYLEHCPGIEQRSDEVLILVRKLSEHKAIDKPKMQQLATTVIVIVAEICHCPVVLKELTECLAGLENAKKKTQGFFKKQVAFMIKLVCQLLFEYGARKMNPKLGYLNLVLKYITDSDRGIREACFSLLVELSAWLGDISEAIKPMDDPQKKEFTKRLDVLKEEGKLQREVRRLYRGEAPSSSSTSKPFDQFDIVDSADSLKKLPKGWCITKVAAMEKWKEKQEYLQVLSSLLDEPRLTPCDGYAAIVFGLQRMLKSESNIPVVTEAAKCMGLMAKGLRKDFEKHARLLLPVVLSRMSDKSVWKPNVFIDRVEQLLWSLSFEVLLEELRPHIASKSLWVKKEALNLLLRALDLPQVQLNCPDGCWSRFLPSVAALSLPLLDDSDNTVRQEAAKLLAALVFRNKDSSEVGHLVLEKLPALRRAVFDDEWRKLSKDLPCPSSSSNSLPAASFSPGKPESDKPSPAGPLVPRRPSPLRLRLASPSRAGPAREEPSEAPPAVPAGGGRRGSPLRSRQQSDGALPEDRFQRSASHEPRQPTTVETVTTPGTAELETPLMRQMAEEIRSLRSKVERMEMERIQVPSTASQPKPFAAPDVPVCASRVPPSLEPRSLAASSGFGSAVRQPSGSRPARSVLFPWCCVRHQAGEADRQSASLGLGALKIVKDDKTGASVKDPFENGTHSATGASPASSMRGVT